MVEICDDCYALEGGVCHNPDCAFYYHDMETVGEVLDILLTRPTVKIEVYADGGCAGNGTDHQRPTVATKSAIGRLSAKSMEIEPATRPSTLP